MELGSACRYVHLKLKRILNNYIPVSTLGMTDLVPYYLPVVTTLMLVIRCIQINRRNKRSVVVKVMRFPKLYFIFRKYGRDWDEYYGKVKANIIPLVF